jgi:hypothetical protein
MERKVDRNWEAVRLQARESVNHPQHREKVINYIMTACENDRTDPFLPQRLWSRYMNGLLEIE